MDAEFVRKCLRYDPSTGRLHWKERLQDTFSDGRMRADAKAMQWNAKHAGNEAFCTKDGRGYLQGHIGGKKYRAHRIVWMIVTGAWPEGEIDHIDGDKSNNRFNNLRSVTHSENMKNMKRSSRNTSGVVGVTWSQSQEKWCASIGHNNTRSHLGFFANKSDAIAARKCAEITLGYHINHGG